MLRTTRTHAMLLAACVVALAGCGKDPARPLPVDSQAPNFTLVDVNPNSATVNQKVSPRFEVGKISAWYFGHAT